MAVNVNQIVIDDFKKFLGRKISTGALNFIATQVQDASLQCDATEVVKNDAHNTAIARWFEGKTATGSATSVILDFNLLSQQLNGEEKTVASATNEVPAPAIEEKVYGASDTLTEFVTAYSVINEGTSAAPVYRITVTVLNKDGTPKKNLTLGDAVGSGVFTYTEATHKLTFNTGEIAVGDRLFVAYEYSTSEATVVYDEADKYASAQEIWGEFIGHDLCDPDTAYVGYVVFPNAVLSASTTVNFGREETFPFEFSASQGYCDEKKQLLRIVLVNPISTTPATTNTEVANGEG